MPLGQLHEERPALLEATDAMSWSPYRSPPGREHFDAPGVERRGHLLRSGRRWLAEDPRHERFRCAWRRWRLRERWRWRRQEVEEAVDRVRERFRVPEKLGGPSCWVDRALVEAVRALGRE